MARLLLEALDLLFDRGLEVEVQVYVVHDVGGKATHDCWLDRGLHAGRRMNLFSRCSFIGLCATLEILSNLGLCFLLLLGGCFDRFLFVD